MSKFNNIEYQKKYYENNKEKILNKLNEKSKCELCGGSYSYTGKNRHLLTKRHIKSINTSIDIPTKNIDADFFNRVRDFMKNELLR